MRLFMLFPPHFKPKNPPLKPKNLPSPSLNSPSPIPKSSTPTRDRGGAHLLLRENQDVKDGILQETKKSNMQSAQNTAITR